MKSFADFLKEAFLIKVNSHGDKTRRLKCPEGYKLNDGGTACVPIPSSEKQEDRVAARKMVRTKKAEGASLKKRSAVRTKKALRYRKGFGL